MEENTTPLDATPTSTPMPVTTQPTAALPVMPTPTVVTPVSVATKTSKLPLIVAGLVAAVVVVAAIAAGVIYLNGRTNGTTNSAAASNISSNPGAVAQELNKQVKDLVLAVTTKDTAKVEAALSNITTVKEGQYEFTLNLDDKASSTTVQVFVDGSAKQVNKGIQMQFTATINAKSEQLNLNDLVLDAILDVKEDKTGMFYLKASKVPADISFIVAALGIDENKWYSIPLTKELTDSATTSTATESEIAQVQTQFQSQDIFTSSVAAADRTIAGTKVPCVSLTLNPELTKSVNGELTPFAPKNVEYCATANADPFYFGTNLDVEGLAAEFGISLKNLGKAVNIEIPTESSDLQTVLESLGVTTGL